MIEGGCACGAIRYQCSVDQGFNVACHCRACQYASGGSPTLAMIVPRAAVTLNKGTPKVYWSRGDSGKMVGRAFCESCGSPVWSEPEAGSDTLILKIGSLDDPSKFNVQVDIYRDAAQPFHRPFEGAMSFPGAPPMAS